MDIHPLYKSLGQTLSDYLFAAPRYQRGYTWDEPEVLDFLNDVSKCFQARRAGAAREHFLGGVVGVEEAIAGSVSRRCQLIDGQQRVTTFILFSRALELTLRGKVEAGEFNESKDFVEESATSIKNDFLTTRIQVNRVYKDEDHLTPSEPDRAFFASLIHQPPADASPSRESHHRLSRALEMSKERIVELIDTGATEQERADAIGVLSDVLRNDLTIILIIAKEASEAYRLFQVLNDRGTNLSEGDLLRAVSLEMLSAPARRSDHERVAEIWDEILAEKPTETERFLRCYYSSVQGQRPGQSSLFDDFVKAFFPTYTGAPLRTSEATALVTRITGLREEFRRYKKIIDGVWPFPASTQTKPAEKERLPMLVKVLDHELCHPLLLAACNLDEKRFKEVVQLTERIAFRYKYVCSGHTGSLNAVYNKQAKAIRDAPATYKVRELQQAFYDLQERRAGNQDFVSYLDRFAYHDSGNNRPIKYFLLTAEYFWRWFEGGANGHPKCHDPNMPIDAESTTVEHIYSRSPGTVDATLAELTNDLGNLALLSQPDNDRVANKAFAQKQPVYRDSMFRLTKPLADLPGWTATAVADRRRLLRDFAGKFFVIAQPSQPRGAAGAAPPPGSSQPRPKRGRPPKAAGP